jgi:hypothetical protein
MPMPTYNCNGSNPPHDARYSQIGHTHAGGSEAFPVGSVFIGVVATNPGTLLGYGTWAGFGSGRVMVGRDGADADFDVAEETGGAKTNTPSAHAGAAVANHVFTQPSGHSNHVFTQSAAHVFTQPSGHSNHVFTQATAHSTISKTTTGSGTTLVSTATHAGSGVDAHSAHAGGAVDAHSGAGVDAHSAHAGGAVDAHGVTQPSNHSALSVVQPYIVCYFWKRTA